MERRILRGDSPDFRRAKEPRGSHHLLGRQLDRLPYVADSSFKGRASYRTRSIVGGRLVLSKDRARSALCNPRLSLQTHTTKHWCAILHALLHPFARQPPI